MPRPLRTRKQPSTAAAPESAPVVAKKSAKPASPIAPAEPKVTKKTRTRSATTVEPPLPEEEEPPVPVKEKKKKTTTRAAKAAAAENEKTSPLKKTRSTKAKTTPSTRSTRRRVEIATEDLPEPQVVIEVPRTPPPQQAPTIAESVSPTQSSNAENHEPQPMPSLTSSPPIMMAPLAQSTPKNIRAQRSQSIEVFEFGSDQGYTPPPPQSRPASTQRPRLAALEPDTLEPLSDPEPDVDLEAEPTPRRKSQRYYADIEEGQPQGRPFFIGPDQEPFMIYSDPKSPTTPPKSHSPTIDSDLDDTLRQPPQSSSPTPRKRRSSDATITADDPSPARAKRQKKPATRGKKALADPATVKTDDLRSLLPRRRRTAKQQQKDIFDLTTSSSHDMTDDSDQDELSWSARSAAAKRRAAVAKKAAKHAKKTHAKTYQRKSDGIVVDDDEEGGEEAEDVATPSSDDTGVVVVDKKGQRKLEQMKAKFQEVDKWGLDFEDVSVGSLGDTSDSQKR
ncbi:hypothetical protein EDC01DRAFT_666573 [Geopyxis carbonaria]|nr:hypothetical protein EDC01DRAFT_666573 [Geopyxis carbonaria]